MPQQETKSSTKQLAPTDPILGPENLLKTGFAQKGLPSCPSGQPQASLKPKHCASATLIQKTSKSEPKHGPKNGTDRLAVPFLGPHVQLSKRTKEKHFHGPIFGIWLPKMRPQNRKINSKGSPVQQTKNYNCVYSSNKHVGLEQYSSSNSIVLEKLLMLLILPREMQSRQLSMMETLRSGRSG